MFLVICHSQTALFRRFGTRQREKDRPSNREVDRATSTLNNVVTLGELYERAN